MCIENNAINQQNELYEDQRMLKYKQKDRFFVSGLPLLGDQ